MKKSLAYTNLDFTEVGKETFLLDHLVPQDATNLTNLLPHLATSLEEIGLCNPAIYAVGSSTFPKWYWIKMREIKDHFRDNELANEINETYNNINLRIASDDIPINDDFGGSFCSYASNLAERLREKHFQVKTYSGSMDAETLLRIPKVSHTYSPFCGEILELNVVHLHGYKGGIQVTFPFSEEGCAPIDIMLKFAPDGIHLNRFDKEGEDVVNPRNRIKIEREGSRSFSLLYPDSVEEL